MIIRFDCGCVAFDLRSKRGEYLIIRACDNSDYLYDPLSRGYNLFWRDMADKKSFPLPEEEIERWLSLLNTSFAEGDKYLNIRHVIKGLINE